MMTKQNTVFVSGYTQAPKGTKLHEVGSILGVMLEINRENHIIVDAECTFYSQLGKNYFKKLMIGYNFRDELDKIIEAIEANLLIPTANSIIVALKITHQRYMDNLAKINKEKSQ